MHLNVTVTAERLLGQSGDIAILDHTCPYNKVIRDDHGHYLPPGVSSANDHVPVKLVETKTSPGSIRGWQAQLKELVRERAREPAVGP